MCSSGRIGNIVRVSQAYFFDTFVVVGASKVENIEVGFFAMLQSFEEFFGDFEWGFLILGPILFIKMS